MGERVRRVQLTAMFVILMLVLQNATPRGARVAMLATTTAQHVRHVQVVTSARAGDVCPSIAPADTQKRMMRLSMDAARKMRSALACLVPVAVATHTEQVMPTRTALLFPATCLQAVQILEHVVRNMQSALACLVPAAVTTHTEQVMTTRTALLF